MELPLIKRRLSINNRGVMEDKDIKNIKYLIKNYSVKEILLEISFSLLNEADYLSDLGLKERSLECINSHELISNILQDEAKDDAAQYISMTLE